MGQVRTIWRVYVCDVGVVGSSAGQQADSRGAAKCDSTVMSTVMCSFLCNVFVQQWHVVERVQKRVLIISNDENDVRL